MDKDTIRNKIISTWMNVCKIDNISAPDFTQNFKLLDSELDSLGFAMLVSELEGVFGIDPFAEAELANYPEDFLTFVSFYHRNIKVNG